MDICLAMGVTQFTGDDDNASRELLPLRGRPTKFKAVAAVSFETPDK